MLRVRSAARLVRCPADGRPAGIRPHNPLLVCIGLVLIYTGFWGFYVACNVPLATTGYIDGLITGATQTGTTIYLTPTTLTAITVNLLMSLSGGMLVGYMMSKGDAFWTYSGGLAGIIAASAGNDLYHPIQALIIGGLGTAFMYKLHFWVERTFKIDDAVGAVAVHGYAGFFGVVIAGFMLWGHPSSPSEGFAALPPLLGYVPQKDILPLQLPVQRALHYVARLRLPPDVTNDEMNARIEEVMRSLDLYDRRDVLLGSLSGGQQKRASIAAELIGKPGLFFLDEPASGLDPGLARRVSAIMRDMANTNSTIVVISHDVEGLQAADKIVLLASGGRVAFIGAPQDAPEYFHADDPADVDPRGASQQSKGRQQRFVEPPPSAAPRGAGVGAGGRRGARRRISRTARHRCALRRQAAHSDGRASVHGVRDALRRDDAERQANAASPVGAGAGDRAAPDSRRQVDRLSTSACRSDLTGGGVRHSSSEAGGDAADHAGGDGHVVRGDQRRS